jgi:hypothetical protein
MRSFDFSIDLIFPAALMALGVPQPLAAMSARDHPEGKGLSALISDKFTAICKPIV